MGQFDWWIAVIPTPFTDADRAVGYWWELSMRQVEASRTLVFDDPRRARGFFEALVADNIGIGRPEEVAAVFARQIRRGRDHLFRTRIFGPGTDVKLEFRYKHSRVKQYLIISSASAEGQVEQGVFGVDMSSTHSRRRETSKKHRNEAGDQRKSASETRSR